MKKSLIKIWNNEEKKERRSKNERMKKLWKRVCHIKKKYKILNLIIMIIKFPMKMSEELSDFWGKSPWKHT